MFRTLYPEMWYALADAKVSPEAKLVRIFAECGPTAHPTGLYSLSILDICNGTGLSEEVVVHAIQELEGKSFFVFDRDRMLVFIHGALRRQFFIKAETANEKQMTGILAHLEHLSPSSTAVQAFMRENFPKADRIPLSDTPTGYPYRIPPSDTSGGNPDRGIGYYRDQIQRPETRKKKEDLPASSPKGVADASTFPTSDSTPEKAKASGNGNGKRPPLERALLEATPLDRRHEVENMLDSFRAGELVPPDLRARLLAAGTNPDFVDNFMRKVEAGEADA